MFREYFAEQEKVRTRLLEGAITFEEYFNKIMAIGIELTQTERYAAFLDRMSKIPIEDRWCAEDVELQ